MKLGSSKHKMMHMKVKLAQPVLPRIKNTTPKKDALAIRSALLHAHHFQTIKPTHTHTHITHNDDCKFGKGMNFISQMLCLCKVNDNKSNTRETIVIIIKTSRGTLANVALEATI